MIWIIVGVVVLLLIAAVVLYNRLVSLRNRVENAWAQVDVQLKRRYDLIPNLVETVKGYASHERETFEAVTAARTRAQQAQGPAEQGAAEGILGQALGRLFAVAEAYPELQADENFRQLQEELAQTENRIAVSRQVYNDTVLTYNTAIQRSRASSSPGRSASRARTSSRWRTRPGRRHASRSSARRLGGSGARARRRRRREVVLPAGGGRHRPGQHGRQPRRRRGDRVRVRAATSAAPTARSRSATASRSIRSPSRRASSSTDRAVAPSSSARARRGRSARRARTRASGSSGTTAPPTRSGASAIHYRLRGVAVAYDDVVDVNLQVWGDEWEVGLDQLTAALIAPGDVLRAWGHPVGVRGDVTIDGTAGRPPRGSASRPASSSSCARSSRGGSSPRPRA